MTKDEQLVRMLQKIKEKACESADDCKKAIRGDYKCEFCGCGICEERGALICAFDCVQEYIIEHVTENDI